MNKNESQKLSTKLLWASLIVVPTLTIIFNELGLEGPMIIASSINCLLQLAYIDYISGNKDKKIS